MRAGYFVHLHETYIQEQVEYHYCQQYMDKHTRYEDINTDTPEIFTKLRDPHKKRYIS